VGNYGIHCTAQETAIHVNEAEFIFELIDPATGESMEGEGRGEMVLTNLGRVSSPSIRFRTGDIVNVKLHACECGRSFLLLDGGIVGRVDDMICVRGINIFPSQVAAIVEKHLVIGEEYQVVAYSEKGMAELKVVCELLAERPHEEVLQSVRKELRDCFEIRIETENVPMGTIRRSDYKSKKFVDKRSRET
jgi:phenylacetate-CoA ligase